MSIDSVCPIIVRNTFDMFVKCCSQFEKSQSLMPVVVNNLLKSPLFNVNSQLELLDFNSKGFRLN